jgi:methionyl-tRNA formyltransferase
MAWDQIVIIGTGPLACESVAIAHQTTPNVICIEPEQALMSRLPALCRQSAIEYRRETDRAALRAYFESIDSPTLVVSAYNNYIFPRTVIENQSLLLVNFHNSLLPRHAGRNAPTWSIFEEDAETGVTWHLVQPSVDAGDIVLQSPLAIDPLVTGIELTRQTLDLGGRTFKDLLPQLWSASYTSRPQNADPNSRLNKSADIPNGGVLDLSWEPHRISALLRSVDYGRLPVFPPVKLTLSERDYRVTSYKIETDPGASPDTKVAPPIVEIHGDGMRILVSLSEGPA